MCSIRAAGLLGLVLLLCLTSHVGAVIMRLTPLADVLAESNLILLTRVESLDAEKRQMVLSIGEALKGKAGFEKLPMLLQGDREADRSKQGPQLLARLKVGLPIVLFINQRDREFVAFGYTNGTWFQATGIQPKDAETPRWSWTHFEPYFRRTFKGTTQELRDTVADALAGKRKPPAADAKEKPGLGPEVSLRRAWGVSPMSALIRREDHGAYAPRSPVPIEFGVIIAPWLVGPFALLAMIFPALFGGLVAGLRRWMTWLTVISLNSTLLVVRDFYLVRAYPETWLASENFIWLAMAVITFAGAWWAWHRCGHFGASHRPGRGEAIFLLSLSLLGAIPFLIWWPRSLAELSLMMKTLAVLQMGLIVATLHTVFAALRSATPSLPGEGVALLTMLLASVVFLPTSGPASALVVAPEQTAPGQLGLQGVVWRFDLPETSAIYSSPTIVGDRVYFGAVHGSAFRSGAVYCVDAKSGQQVWSFRQGLGGRSLHDIFSSPTVADGCVYIGEGFHFHAGCALYCLDAATGEKKWEFETASHTESSPCVVAGRVYFGAGDDGMYCLDAKSGKELWHLQALHIDANPLVAGGKVYVGSGKGDAFMEFAIVCLDAVTGKEEWRMPMDLPSWGGAALVGDRLLVSIGNGIFTMSDPEPAGAILALDAKTGRRLWRTDAKQIRDGVHVRLASDGTRVWAASRDQRAICLNLADGKTIWERDLGSPIVASPALVPDLAASVRLSLGQPAAPNTTAYSSLIVATSGGLVASLDPADGTTQWIYNAGQNAVAEILASPAVAVSLDFTGERRRIVVGTILNSSKGVLLCLEDQRKP